MKKTDKKIFIFSICLILFWAPFFSLESKNIIKSAPNSAEKIKSWKLHQKLKNESPLKKLKWRTLGPAFAGGRIESIACPPGDSRIIYMGAGSGNLWKSVNHGFTWEPIFEHESTFAIGCVAVSSSNPKIVWAGTGEVLMARSSYSGTGIFKSLDGGLSWENMGLHDSYHISRVLIDPGDHNTVYVAAIGHNYSYNKERGLFKTIDGGKSWEQILYISDRVGCVEVVMDPGDSRILYAVMWERDRKAWNHIDKGINSGVYKSSDAGKNWKRLQGGLPQGKNIGRIGLAVSISKPWVLYAVVDNHNSRQNSKRRIGGEVYRSDNKGQSWKKTHQKPLKTAIGYDFCLLRISPDNENQIYVLGNYLLQSDDGGKTFRRNQGKIVHLRPHGSQVLHLDHHELWIDPQNSRRLILGTDGGIYISSDRGGSWLHMNNIPIAEVYAVTVDNSVPYNIYIGTQDNAALLGPSSYTSEDMKKEPWKHIYLDRWGGGDSYFTRLDPSDHDFIYYEHQFGALARINTGNSKKAWIRPKAKKGESRLRRNWMTPFIISRTNPKILYYGAQKVFKSFDRGRNWKCISPDLTTNPGSDKQGNVPYGTITSISESPLMPELMYIGTDDGNLQITKNGGKTWEKISRNLPDKWVSRVIASRFKSNRVYVSFTGYREDDFSPYLYKSENFGKTWKPISKNLPQESINVIREDFGDEDILYLGTDLGVYVSLNGGYKWFSLCNNLPTTPVHDLVIHPRENEMIIGTHGRGCYILDIKPVQKRKEIIPNQKF